MTVRAMVAAAAVLSLAGAAAAHDLWLEPAAHRVPVGSKVSPRILNGDRLRGEAIRRDDARLERFDAIPSEGAKIALTGRSGDDPAGSAVLPSAGLWTLVYATKARAIELDAARFEAYLAEEGLERIVAERKRLGESEKPGRELYARCAKAVVLAEPADGTSAVTAGHDRPTGLRLDLVPESDPFAVRAGEELAFRLLFDGKPVAGAKVVVRSFDAPDEPSSARTGDDGRCRVAAPRAGRAFAGAVHMIRSDPARTLVEWESFWASLTYEVKPRIPAVAPGEPAAPK